MSGGSRISSPSLAPKRVPRRPSRRFGCDVDVEKEAERVVLFVDSIYEGDGRPRIDLDSRSNPPLVRRVEKEAERDLLEQRRWSSELEGKVVELARRRTLGRRIGEDEVSGEKDVEVEAESKWELEDAFVARRTEGEEEDLARNEIEVEMEQEWRCENESVGKRKVDRASSEIECAGRERVVETTKERVVR